jgi:hypothetical protein
MIVPQGGNSAAFPTEGQTIRNPVPDAAKCLKKALLGVPRGRPVASKGIKCPQYPSIECDLMPDDATRCRPWGHHDVMGKRGDPLFVMRRHEVMRQAAWWEAVLGMGIKTERATRR